jgi:hypothetical protein
LVPWVAGRSQAHLRSLRRDLTRLRSEEVTGPEPAVVLAGEDTCPVSEPVRKKADESRNCPAQSVTLAIMTLRFTRIQQVKILVKACVDQ